MSRKNHKIVNGKLLQTDKRFSQLKMKQREKIYNWMYEETLHYYMNKHKMPYGKQCNIVVDAIYDRIIEAEIWIPYKEVRYQYIKKKTKLINKLTKKINQTNDSDTDHISDSI